MLIYLASPYSHPDEAVRHERYEHACRAAARIMERGHVVFSPIAHSHSVAAHLPETLLMDHEFWMKQCLPMVECCHELWVLDIDGHATSRGVRAEIIHAWKRDIPIRYKCPAFL